jgi:hypothetical protein
MTTKTRRSKIDNTEALELIEWLQDRIADAGDSTSRRIAHDTLGLVSVKLQEIAEIISDQRKPKQRKGN